MNEMYCDLQSRGIKRKFVEDDDSGDQTQHPLPTSDAIQAINSNNLPQIVPKVSTTKSNIQTTITSRILHHNLTVQHCYVRQRQQIFNISMCKLNRFRQSPDPNLWRSVLICNTLRTLERELDREGVKINFGPNGVSFIPPVLNTQNMTLDPPPSASNTLIHNQNNNNITANSVNQLDSSVNTTSNASNYVPVCPIGAETVNITDNSNGEYDKYLLDLDASSGRVTPFHKSLSQTSSSVYDNESSMDFTSNSANSAFWGSDEASDRLTSINWSSVLNFNSSLTASTGATGAHKTTQFTANGHNAINGSDGSVSSSESENSLIASNPNSNSASQKSSTSSFTTLLPPTTSSSTVTSTTTTLNTASSLSQSSTSLSSPLSQNSITSQSVTNSHSVNHLSVINTNSITYSNTTNDEIFGDIDLSLYDFDLLSPLSPPNVKLAPITAEELIRTIAATDSNSSCVSSSITMTSSSMSPPLSSTLSSSSSSNGSTVCSSSSTSGFNRYFKSSDKLFSEDRDQQAITPVMS